VEAVTSDGIISVKFDDGIYCLFEAFELKSLSGKT
jgi:hypothetical protein